MILYCPVCTYAYPCPCPEGDPNAANHSLESIHGPGLDYARSLAFWRQQVWDEEEERRRLIAQLENERAKNRF
jgi:hypothetical protein